MLQVWFDFLSRFLSAVEVPVKLILSLNLNVTIAHMYAHIEVSQFHKSQVLKHCTGHLHMSTECVGYIDMIIAVTS